MALLWYGFGTAQAQGSQVHIGMDLSQESDFSVKFTRPEFAQNSERQCELGEPQAFGILNSFVCSAPALPPA